MYVCVLLTTDAVHLPRPPWAGQASLIHIPQIIEGHPRRAEASLDPPGQTLVNSTHAHRPTGIRKAGRCGGIFRNFSNCSSPEKNQKITFEHAELCASSQGAKTALNMNGPKQANRHSRSLLWVRSTLYRPSHPPTPTTLHYCVDLALMLVERGTLVGEGMAEAIVTRAIVSQRPLFRVI